MADIFVSYASQDRTRVRRLVDALEAAGFSVWWDRRIDIGTPFDRMIEAAIDRARCVIVIWSATSTNSDWVRAEAAEGLERGVLVPVLFDDVRPPLLFRQQHACRLIDWPDLQEEEFEKLLIIAKRVLAAEQSTDKDEPRQAPSVTVLLADFQNETDIDVYSGSIDEALRLSLEDVAGVYIYPRDQAIQILNQGALDIEAATRLGAREGLDFIVGGRVHRLGPDAAFEIEIRPIADPENVVRHMRKLGGLETVGNAVTELTNRWSRPSGLGQWREVFVIIH